MSPPRRHYGPKPPGRLQATLLKVIAAELTDGGRLGRGKRYFNDDAVIDIAIEPGLCNVVVQGSSASPYEVSLYVRPGEGAPSAADLDARCNCVDSERGAFCKHSVAAVFALANEVAIEPEQLARWRSGPDSTPARSAPLDDSAGGDDGDLAEVIQLFGDTEPAAAPTPTKHDEEVNADEEADEGDVDADAHEDRVTAEINAMLRPPHGVTFGGAPGTGAPPDLPVVVSVGWRPTGNDTTDRLLRSAFEEFDLNWHH